MFYQPCANILILFASIVHIDNQNVLKKSNEKGRVKLDSWLRHFQKWVTSKMMS